MVGRKSRAEIELEAMMVEESFKSRMQLEGFSSIRATDTEDMFEHWDFRITNGLESYKVDVKGLKRDSRSDLAPNDNYHVVEFKNVHGKNGWIFGKADLIAFETLESWVLVDRIRLKDFALVKVMEQKAILGDEIHVDKPADCQYKLYTRKDRDDLMTKVTKEDIISIAFKTLNKKHVNTN